MNWGWWNFKPKLHIIWKGISFCPSNHISYMIDCSFYHYIRPAMVSRCGQAFQARIKAAFMISSPPTKFSSKKTVWSLFSPVQSLMPSTI